MWAKPVDHHGDVLSPDIVSIQRLLGGRHEEIDIQELGQHANHTSEPYRSPEFDGPRRIAEQESAYSGESVTIWRITFATTRSQRDAWNPNASSAADPTSRSRVSRRVARARESR